jgi:hypothetical protein
MADWKQNNMAHAMFVLTPRWMLFCLTFIAILFLPLGIGFYVNNRNVSGHPFFV